MFFSTKAIFVKLTYLYGADAISALALRMIMALPMLLLIAWYSTRQSARPLTRADWKGGASCWGSSATTCPACSTSWAWNTSPPRWSG